MKSVRLGLEFLVFLILCLGVHGTTMYLWHRFQKVKQDSIPEGLDRATMGEMRRVVGKAREMQAQRAALLQQLRGAVTADDITAVLLAGASEDHDEIFKQELEKHTPKVTHTRSPHTHTHIISNTHTIHTLSLTYIHVI